MTIKAFTMYDAELDEWYISIYDTRNPDAGEQFFGYTTEQQAADDIPACIRKMRARDARG